MSLYSLLAATSPTWLLKAHWVSFFLLSVGVLSVFSVMWTLTKRASIITPAVWIAWIRTWGSRIFLGRKTEGDASYGAIGLMLFYGLVLAMIPTAIALARYYDRYPIYELKDVEVLAHPKPFEFWMHYTSESSGPLDFYARFCPDYKPGFEPGDTLNLLRYEDRGACWGLTNEHAGYLIRRDSDGHTNSENERSRQTTQESPAGPSSTLP